jgi:hypothetical protein
MLDPEYDEKQISAAYEAAAQTLWDNLPEAVKLALVRNQMEGIHGVAEIFGSLLGQDQTQKWLLQKVVAVK